MKNINITLQPLSLLVGAALIVVVGLTVSAVLPGGPTGRDAQLVTIDGQPAARDLVMIRGNAPYTVPMGKILVIGALGSSGLSTLTTMQVDGTTVASSYIFTSVTEWNTSSFKEIPVGLPVMAGSTVTLNTSEASALGHLEDA